VLAELRGDTGLFRRSGPLEFDVVGDPTEADLLWLEPRFGGRATLASYGVKTGGLRGRRAILEDARTAVPRHHLQFLETLEPMRATVDLLFVHAGIRPGVPVTLQDPEDLMWIRDPFLLDPRDHGPLVVHGHTFARCPSIGGTGSTSIRGPGTARR
jgi:serine/threonine protein phosphatase 1